MADDQDRDAVVIERIIEAPVDLVWQMWTEPEHFAAWYGPGGATVTVTEMDVRVGGPRLVGMEMQTPDGAMTMWLGGEHREVTPPRLLAYTESICDEHGNVLSPAASGTPEAVTTDVTVELDELDGNTKTVMTHAGVPAGSPGDAGWRMAFDKLVDYVGTLPRQ